MILEILKKNLFHIIVCIFQVRNIAKTLSPRPGWFSGLSSSSPNQSRQPNVKMCSCVGDDEDKET